MHVIAYTCKQPPQAVISMAGYGLTGKRLQPARLRNLYGGLQLTETTAAYGGLRRRLRGLHRVMHFVIKFEKLEIWANAQRDGRPVEYSFNAAKFG